MPWSDWVQTPLSWKPKPPEKYADTGTSSENSQPIPGNGPEQIEQARAGARGGENAATEIISPYLTFDTVSAQQSLGLLSADPNQVSASGKLAQRVAWHVLRGDEQRDSYPPELQDMVEGVDFTMRPDRDGSQIDSFIEYEDGLFLVQSSDIQGWQGAVTLKVTKADLDNGSVTQPASFEARIYQPQPQLMPWPVPVETEGQSTAAPVVPPFGSGFTVAQVVGGVDATATGTVSAPAGATGFCWVVEPDFSQFDYSAGIFTGMASIRHDIKWGLLFPRWRYWVPGEKPIPLRQRQRDDGLSSSTIRARGVTSQQRSIRQRGYI